jgi:molybdenum cofactor cytidylyltransferase
MANSVANSVASGARSKKAPTKAVAILLAAGAGTRYDPTGRHNKLMATIDGRPIACHAAQALLDAGLPTVAVLRSAGGALPAALDAMGCFITICGAANDGMGISLAHGVKVANIQYKPERVLIALGDMPFIETAVVKQVVDAVSPEQTIVAAATDGKRGHPVGFWRDHIPALSELTGDAGAAQLLKDFPVSLVESASDGAIRDIDKPNDLPS